MESVLLFTSTEPPYIKDVLDILFLPSGCDYRFRYGNTWIPEEYKSIEELKKLKDKTGYIIHIHITKDETGYLLLEFIPVRKVIIKNVKYFDEFLWVSFELSDWIVFTSKEDDRNKIIEAMPDEYRKYLTKLIIPSKIYRPNTIEEDTTDDVITNWFKIVNTISSLEPHKDSNSIFLKMLRITDVKGVNQIKPTRTNYGQSDWLYDTEKHSIFEFKPNNDYKFEVLQFHPYGPIKKPITLALQYDKEKVTPLKESSIIQGKYDVLQYSFRTSSSLSSMLSYLKLVVENLGDNSITISDSFLDIKVKKSILKFILLVISLFIGYWLPNSGIFPSLPETILAAISSMIVAITLYFIKKE